MIFAKNINDNTKDLKEAIDNFNTLYKKFNDVSCADLSEEMSDKYMRIAFELFSINNEISILIDHLKDVTKWDLKYFLKELETK